MGECCNCARPAAGSYSLVLGTGPTFRDRPLCEPCRGFFAASAAFEVVEAPVLMRGGEEAEQE